MKKVKLIMKFIIRNFLTIIIILFANLLHSQIAYEYVISNDSSYASPANFIRNNTGGFVGFVQKGIYGGRLYSISHLGDTTSVSINKPDESDTLFVVRQIIPVCNDNYSYLLSCSGSVTGNISGEISIFIAIDSELNIVWEKEYLFDYYYGIQKSTLMQKKDSSFIFGCTPHYYYQVMYLFEFDINGDSLNFRDYTGDSAGVIQELTYNSDSTNILLHNTWSYEGPTGLTKSNCITLDDNLEQLDVRWYPESYLDWFSTMNIPGNRLLSCGFMLDWDIYRIATYIIKDDSSFTVENTYIFPEIDTVSYAADWQSVDYYYPGCYFVGGTYPYYGSYNPSWFYVAMLNDTLGVEYEKYIGGDQFYRLLSITASEDGGVLLAGITQELSWDLCPDAYLVKLDSTGCYTGTDENIRKLIHEAIVYPNPGSAELNVRTALKNCTFELYNSVGLLVLKEALDNTLSTYNTVLLPPGSYMYRITTSQSVVESGVWIKN